MLEFELERALDPEMMRKQPCGVCGLEFKPEAVQACLVTPHEYVPTCEVCLSHLAHRAEEEPIPADWNEVYKRYLDAVAKYPKPMYASSEGVIAAEMRDPKDTAIYSHAARSI